VFSWFTKPKRHTARINGRAVTVEPGETLLKAALRQGIDYPHHCGLGGCGICKCRLVDGNVEQITDSSYVLSAAEVAGGYILACQSLARSDLSVAVELPSSPARERPTGRVSGQSRE
jgi:ferredoxin